MTKTEAGSGVVVARRHLVATVPCARMSKSGPGDELFDQGTGEPFAEIRDRIARVGPHGHDIDMGVETVCRASGGGQHRFVGFPASQWRKDYT